MDRARALSVLAEKVDESPLIRLAEAIMDACEATERQNGRQRERHVEADLKVRAGRVTGARVAVAIEA